MWKSQKNYFDREGVRLVKLYVVEMWLAVKTRPLGWILQGAVYPSARWCGYSDVNGCLSLVSVTWSLTELEVKSNR